MSFIENNWEYINITATALAIEIARMTGRWDVEDYKQSMFLSLVKQASSYNPNKSKPSTFINLVLRSTKKMLLRSFYQGKNQLIFNAEAIHA